VIDPRPQVIGRRLAPVRRILAFSSAKGGVGKSVCCALSALALRRAGRSVGLLDLDFQGASAHLLLKVKPGFPEEQGGIRPLRAREGVDFMSFAAFSRENAVPLRGGEVSEALLEMLAVTVWAPLDFLLLDMPPGIGDELLDVLRLLSEAEFVVVATPSALALQVVERLLVLLEELRLPVRGLIENMARAGDAGGTGGSMTAVRAVAAAAERHGLPVLGSVPYLPEIEELLASPDPLRGDLGEAFGGIARYLIGQERIGVV
jgi:ATP-binding protein involved in chromosome partitioning